MLKLSKFILLFVTFFIPKSVHQNPDLNIIIHLDESEEYTDGLPKIGRGVDGENKQFVVGKCKEDQCMENGKCIRMTYINNINYHECNGKCFKAETPCNGKCHIGYCVSGQKCIKAWANGMHECDGKCITLETPCNGQCSHHEYCKLGNKCEMQHWYVKEDEGEKYKSCNGECLEKSEKCNGKCEHYECEMNDGSCMISELPERVWRNCNGKCIKTSSKCNGICGEVFSPQCERSDGTCADLVEKSNVKRRLMFGICDQKCLQLISLNSTPTCNGNCSKILKFEALLEDDKCYYKELFGHIDTWVRTRTTPGQ